MKIFIGQRVTGENITNLKNESMKLVEVLKSNGHKPYCTFLESNGFDNKSNKEKMDIAFKKIKDSDLFFAIVRNENRSEGLLMEIGYSIAKKKIIYLAINEDVQNTYLREIAKKVIEYKNFEDLLNKIKELY